MVPADEPLAGGAASLAPTIRTAVKTIYRNMGNPPLRRCNVSRHSLPRRPSKIIPHQQFRDLHRVQRRALADVVGDRKSTRLNSSHMSISYAVFCLKKKKSAPHL